ncbi:MAG: hypothetical protein K2W85_10180 [Phycisphaerales bacterium]|nr:hypothetical protein [Phycisphaerales bacterium]
MMTTRPAAQQPSSPAAQQPSSPAAQQPSSPPAHQPSELGWFECARRVSGFMMLFLALFLPATPSVAQVFVLFQTSDQAIATAFGADKVLDVNRAIERARSSVEAPLLASSAVMVVDLNFVSPCPPNNPNCPAVADANTPDYAPSWAAVRGKLITVGDGSDGLEFQYYSVLPASSVPFRWSSDATPPQLSSTIGMKYPLLQHLQLNPVGTAMTIRMKLETGTFKWQFKAGKLRQGFTSFESVLVHETMHLLGFDSQCDNGSSAVDPDGTPPSYIDIQDVFRFSNNTLPPNISSAVRELRPMVQASLVVRPTGATNPATGAIPMSRGVRPQGDGNQASHFLAAILQTPPTPLGIMDPFVSQLGGGADLQGAYYTRNDWEVLDFVGWDCDPSTITYKVSTNVPTQSIPAPQALVRSNGLRFEWQLDSDSTEYIVGVFMGNDPNNADPLYEYQVAFPTTSVVMPIADRLIPGLYSWSVVGWNTGGATETDIRSFIVACYADFNLDGNGDQLDIFDFLNDWFAGDLDADFDQDGMLTSLDIFEFLNAWFLGCA